MSLSTCWRCRVVQRPLDASPVGFGVLLYSQRVAVPVAVSLLLRALDRRRVCVVSAAAFQAAMSFEHALELDVALRRRSTSTFPHRHDVVTPVFVACGEVDDVGVVALDSLSSYRGRSAVLVVGSGCHAGDVLTGRQQ